MISVPQIDRLFHTQRFDQLLDSLASNGLELCPRLRLRLAQHPTAAIALGLRRLVELTWGPNSLVREMTQALIDAQHHDGSYDRDPLTTATVAAALARVVQQSLDLPAPHTPHAPRTPTSHHTYTPASHTAACGLAPSPHSHPHSPNASLAPLTTHTSTQTITDPLIIQARDAYYRAINALAPYQNQHDLLADPTDDRTLDDQLLVSTFMLYLLADHQPFRGALNFAGILSAIEQHEKRLTSSTERLWLMARLHTAPQRAATPRRITHGTYHVTRKT